MGLFDDIAAVWSAKRGAGDSPLGSALGLAPGELNELMAEAMAATGDPAAAAMATSPTTAALPRWVRDMQLAKPLRKDVRATVGERGDEGLLGQLVFMGQKEKTKQVDLSLPGVSETGGGGPRELPQEPTYGTKTSTKDKVRSVDQAMSLPYTWEDDEIKSAMERMRDAGFEVKSFDDVVGVWGSLVERAALTYTATEGKKKVTPWDVLDMNASETGIPDGRGGFTGRKTQTAKNVSEISEGQAWSVLQSNLSQMLGRDPSDQEVRDFTYRMNQLAAKNPSISKTVTRYKNGEAVSSNTTTDPGFTGEDALQKAYKRAQNDPEYAEYQAATTYFEAAMGALGAIGDA